MVPDAQALQLTVEEQLRRAEANQLFRDGDIAGAAVAYEAALHDARLDENKLPLLSNLGFCHLKLGAPAAAAPHLLEALRLGGACFTTPVLAAKVAGRYLEAIRALSDSKGERAAIAEARFYSRIAVSKGLKPPALKLPEAPPAESVTALLMAVGEAQDDDGIDRVRAALHEANGEALDKEGMNALCLSVHISCLRADALGTRLLGAVLHDGTPPDARHENGKTALMLAANNGRLDLCKTLLEAGASPSAIDGDGQTALHAAAVDLHLAAERAEAGLQCDPGGVFALLLSRGAPIGVQCRGSSQAQLFHFDKVERRTARAYCEAHAQVGNACAQACLQLFDDFESSKTLEVTRL
jgi:tetratricopeptide (TPR) repeat protein